MHIGCFSWFLASQLQNRFATFKGRSVLLVGGKVIEAPLHLEHKLTNNWWPERRTWIWFGDVHLFLKISYKLSVPSQLLETRNILSTK